MNCKKIIAGLISVLCVVGISGCGNTEESSVTMETILTETNATEKETVEATSLTTEHKETKNVGEVMTAEEKIEKETTVETEEATTEIITEEPTTEIIITEAIPIVEEPTEQKNNEYKIKYGEFISAIKNNIDGKSVIVIKAKIEKELTNKKTINQNYFNVEDLIINQGCDQYDEIQYWAIADMADGSEGKVISFTIGKDIIQSIANRNFPVNILGDYASELWILPSLQN